MRNAFGGHWRKSGLVRALLVGSWVAAALLVVPAASGKVFQPGDVRLCNAKRCVPINNRVVLSGSSARSYYGSYALTTVRTAGARATSFGSGTLRVGFVAPAGSIFPEHGVYTSRFAAAVVGVRARLAISPAAAGRPSGMALVFAVRRAGAQARRTAPRRACRLRRTPTPARS
jgi:hypothetical protein